MNIAFHALPSETVQAIRRTGRDAYGNPVERHHTADGTWPCRNCMGEIPAGSDYLILAHRPFRTDNPYAETGPIFLCATDCRRAESSAKVPPVLTSPDYIVRGYGPDERIVYGTGKVTPTRDIVAYAAELLARDDIAFVDIRSAANNCYQCRVRRS